MIYTPKVGDRLVSDDGQRVAIVRELSLGYAAWLWVRDFYSGPSKYNNPNRGTLILSNLAGWAPITTPLQET